jgi:hypothetical protein
MRKILSIDAGGCSWNYPRHGFVSNPVLRSAFSIFWRGGLVLVHPEKDGYELHPSCRIAPQLRRVTLKVFREPY